MNKKPWQSKTLWVNVLTVAITIGGIVAGAGVIENQHTVKWILLGVAIMNVLLRLITKKGISIQTEEQTGGIQ